MIINQPKITKIASSKKLFINLNIIIINYFLLVQITLGQSLTTNTTNLIELTILHSNDTHGHFAPDKDGKGGFAAQKTYVDQIRKEVEAKGGNILLLSAGDINTGTPLSDLLDAEPDFIGMNMIGYDTMALGNHEFDKSFDVLQKQQKIAKFPFLSANIYQNPSLKQRLFQTHLSKDFNGFKVTVFGLTTEDTPTRTNSQSAKEFFFRPIIEEAKDLVPILRAESDILIGLTHIGYYPQEKAAQKNQAKNHAPGDIALAHSVEGIDFILGGHTQVVVHPPDIQNGSHIFQAGEWGKYLGRIDLVYDLKNKKIIDLKHELIPINQEPPFVNSDPEMEKIFNQYSAKMNDQFKIVIGESTDYFYGRPAHLNKETNMGRFIAKAQLDLVEADLSLINNNAIRVNWKPGQLTYEDALSLFPFSNEICSVDLTPKEIRNYLEQVDDIVHLSGISLHRDQETKKIIKFKIGKDEYDENDLRRQDHSSNKTYRLLVNDFLTSGGDNYPKLNHHPSFVNSRYKVFDAVLNYIKKNKVIKNEDFAQESWFDIKNEK